MLNQATPYAKAAAQFPLTAQSFVTPDIPASDAATVYQDLANHLPPLLVPLASDPKQATVARIVQASTDLSFLFAGQADAPNKRNQVLSILLATQRNIYFTEFAFALVTSGAAFVSRNINAQQSARSLRQLAAQTPALMRLDPAQGQSRAISAYDGATRRATLAAPWDPAALPGPSSLYAVWREATKGVALGGTVDTLALAADASDDPAAYVGMELRLTSGAGADQRAAIVGYDAATRVATVSPAWVALPGAGTGYAIAQALATGVAVAADASTLTLQATASADSGAYAGCSIDILLSGVLTPAFSASTRLDFLFVSQGAGQSAAISAYDGASRVATVPAWSVTPDDTTCYQVVQTGKARRGARTRPRWCWRPTPPARTGPTTA